MSVSTDQEKTAVINFLKNCDCCARCILRYLGTKSSQMYLKPQDYLNSFCEDENKDVMLDLPPKRIKKNPCRSCLDIFEDSTLEKFADCITSANVNEYSYTDFTTTVKFPKCVVIRTHSMFIYLKEKFPNIYTNIKDLENLNKVFRIPSNEITSKIINKIYSPRSEFVINFEIDYEDDEQEVQNITNLNYLIKKGNQQDTSRNVIIDTLSKCDDKLFKEQFSVPPSIPVKETTQHVHCMAEPMWIGGRYLKFSRVMGQTPFIINDKLITEHSVQDIIFESIEEILGCNKKILTFCASGREDSDVRMVGNGRPFYVQIDDPKNRAITFEMYRAIEKKIFESKLIAVVKLQEISRDHTKKIKDGEQYKRKHYHALCQTNATDINDITKKINLFNNDILEIQQKTPLRVLHRRSQAVRKKCIYSMEAKIVSGYPDLIEVKLVTQAGTYVKEFINGDFQRTQPSLSSIIQCPIDVVALDVTKIELTWPEEENNA